MITYSYNCSCGKGANIPRPSPLPEYGANSVHTKARQMHQPCLCLCLGSEQMTITLPLRRMILHFSHIGFTDGRTFILVPPVAVIFPQQIQAPFERMLNYYSRIYLVFNKKFQSFHTVYALLNPAAKKEWIMQKIRAAMKRLLLYIKFINRIYRLMSEEVLLP